MGTYDLISQLAPDREVAEPSYLQLAQRLTDLIESGEIPDGLSLPSERALAEKLQLSRTTVRRAYDELRAKDYLWTRGRAGVSVKAPPRLSPRLGRLKGFTEEMRELGVEPSTRLLEREIATDRTISSLARFLRLLRLRLGNGVPLSRELAWYDLTAAPQLADWDVAGSAYQYLEERCGIVLASGEQTIEAVMSSTAEAEFFEFPEPGPCLLMKRRTFSAAGQLIEYVEGTFRGDAYAYRVTLKLSAALTAASSAPRGRPSRMPRRAATMAPQALATPRASSRASPRRSDQTNPLPKAFPAPVASTCRIP